MRRTLWVFVSFFSVIMIAVATRRILHLWSPAADLDGGLARHPYLTLAHIVPGLAFICSDRCSLWTGCESDVRPCIAGRDACFSPPPS